MKGSSTPINVKITYVINIVPFYNYKPTSKIHMPNCITPTFKGSNMVGKPTFEMGTTVMPSNVLTDSQKFVYLLLKIYNFHLQLFFTNEN